MQVETLNDLKALSYSRSTIQNFGQFSNPPLQHLSPPCSLSLMQINLFEEPMSVELLDLSQYGTPLCQSEASLAFDGYVAMCFLDSLSYSKQT